MKPNSLMRRVDAFWTARPDEGLSLADACEKFGCTPEQFARAVDKANRVLGTGIGAEPFFRLGPRSGARKGKKSGKTPPIRPDAASSSVFSGHVARIKVGAGNVGPRLVERDDGVVRVVSITEQETPEWQAREAARRARQVVPKPSGRAKTRSKKLLELIGEGDET